MNGIEGESSWDLFLKIVAFATEYADGLNVLWAVAIGLATAALFFLRPIYRVVFKKPNEADKVPSPATVVIHSHDRGYFRDLIKQELEAKNEDLDFARAESPAGVSDVDSSVLFDALERLSTLRQKLRPQDLTPTIFPRDLDVIDFNKDGKFRIRSPVSNGARIFVGLFCLPHYLIFPELLGRWLISPWIGLIVGGLLWLWRVRLGHYVSIDLSKEKHALVMPAAASWSDGFPSVELKSSYIENQWTTALTIAGLDVIERTSADEPDESDLKEFSNSLKWRFRHQIEVAEGVYIAP